MKTEMKVLAAAIALVASGSAMAKGVGLNGSGGTFADTTTNFTTYVLLGDGASGTGVAVGGNAKADNDTTLTTSPTITDGTNTVAVGKEAKALVQGSTSIGANTYTTALDATTVGVLSEAHSERSTAIGTYATVLDGAKNSIALGERSSVSSKDIIKKDDNIKSKFIEEALNDAEAGVVSVGQSVATNAQLKANRDAGSGSGTNTTTDDSNYYSSSNGAINRRIINVAGGVNDTDAVNIKQLTKVNDDLTTKINKNTTDIETNTKAINSHTTQIAALQNADVQINQRIDANTADIATNAAKIATNAANIETNTKAINLHTAQIADLQNADVQINKRIDATNQNLERVEQNAYDGTALALAAAGLIQPPEGKNGLVIGAGTYRNSNAVAIGYGYTGSSWGLKFSASATDNGNVGGTISTGIFW